MNVLVTGGAGYIGSVVVEQLLKLGHQCVVYDNLSLGHAAALSEGAIFVRGDLSDEAVLVTIITRHQIDAVVHLAAASLVPESILRPDVYFANNVGGGVTLLNAMRIAGVKQLIYSSSAAVYGIPATIPVTEDAPLHPLSPYGESKLALERMLPWYSSAWGLKYVILRYFNAAGASGRLGEDHRPETHLIPNVLRVAAGRASHVEVYGDDYPTADGTAIRDYVHVTDLGLAHSRALEALGASASSIFNVGTGSGHSVAAIIHRAAQLTGAAIPTVIRPRRPGDPPRLVADSGKIQRELGWLPQHSTLDEILASAWRWLQEHPAGYPAHPSRSEN